MPWPANNITTAYGAQVGNAGQYILIVAHYCRNTPLHLVAPSFFKITFAEGRAFMDETFHESYIGDGAANYLSSIETTTVMFYSSLIGEKKENSCSL